MTSALFERKEIQKALQKSPAPHWSCNKIQYLDRAFGHDGQFHISYYAAINECTLRKVRWPTRWSTDAHINTDAKTHMSTVCRKVTACNVWEKDIWRRCAACCYGTLPEGEKTHTHRRTPTHNALSILKKLEQSHACEHTNIHTQSQSIPVLLKKEK